MNNILIVDDDRQICALVKNYLEQHGFNVLVSYDGIAMQRILKRYAVDLVLLDIMLPGADGITLCRKLREESSVAIIMLTAVGEEADRVMSLEMGADDYLTKPFSLRELLARIKSVLRRAKGSTIKNVDFKFADWTLAVTRHCLFAPDGVTVPLTHAEYEILLALLEHAGQSLTRDQLLDLTSGREAEPFDRSIDVLIGRLRKKIEVDSKNPAIIITVRGVGYQLNVEVTRG